MTRPWIIVVLLVASFLRVVELGDLPPGWRDDEIVETTLHAQMVLDGERPLFFVQAEGHEPLYHYLSAGGIALFGRGLFHVRILSAAFGVLGIAALIPLGRRWFGAPVALLAATATAVSFWALMYSRVKTRHVGELVFVLLAFHFFRVLETAPRESAVRNGLLAGLCLALSLHTYFAARAAPVVLTAYLVYVILFHRSTVQARWHGYVLAIGLTVLLSFPMLYAERVLNGGAERLSVVGGPLRSLLAGDIRPALENTLTTLGMFVFTGDPEALYNIPGRPVFGVTGAVFFLVGVLAALRNWRRPAHAFVLLWLLGGLAPAFVSIPAASLGHTLTAQPAVYLLAALGVERAARGAQGRIVIGLRPLSLFALLLILPLAARDLTDYFFVWPRLPEVRFLYRAELHDATDWLRAHPKISGNIAVSSLNVDSRDPLAFALDLPGRNFAPRFFDPGRSMVFPEGAAAPTILFDHIPAGEPFTEYYGGVLIQAVREPAFVVYLPGAADPKIGDAPAVPFSNGLSFTGLNPPAETGPGTTFQAITQWRVEPGFEPPPLRQPSDPTQTPVGLKAFVHLVDASGAWVAGGDDFAVEPSSLRPGDVVLQLHTLTVPPDLPPGKYSLGVGLYEPYSSKRIRLVDGRESLPAGEITIP